MKYKDIDFELPPIGEMICVKDDGDDENVYFGYFYTLRGEKNFHQFYCIEGDLFMGCESPKKWAKMPKFKSVGKKHFPPAGKGVLGRVTKDSGVLGFGLVSYVSNIDCFAISEGAIEAWIELEAFDEE